jgi:hypothetical protein
LRDVFGPAGCAFWVSEQEGSDAVSTSQTSHSNVIYLDAALQPIDESQWSDEPEGVADDEDDDGELAWCLFWTIGVDALALLLLIAAALLACILVIALW